MFYQNSNDLVKNASFKSGHVQHSKETQKLLTSQQPTFKFADNDYSSAGAAGAGADARPRMNENEGASLSMGTQFQNMIQSLVGGIFSTKEGLTAPANPSTGLGAGGNSDFIQSMAKEDKEYTKEQLAYSKKVEDIMNFITKDDKNRRQNWVQVTDQAGITKYGYITKDGIFQIWNVSSFPIELLDQSNWLDTNDMKENTGVIGCPAPSSTIQKIKIAGKWDDIKPYSMVYADTDSSRTNPLFMIINPAVRDPRNTPGGRGLFSCANERGNVYVKERPSADFNMNDKIKMGCYVLGDNVEDKDLTDRGFTFQHDLSEASISQCKRRAEDLGSSYFLVGAPEPGNPNNRGGCWIYTGSGKPNLEGLMVMSADESKCHNVNNKESDEDGYLKAYTTTTLKRLYGKNHEGSSTTFISKQTGMWGGEGPNEYTCNGATGRNTTGNWGDFNRYCIFDKEEDAKNWCASDVTCKGYVNNRPNMYQATRKPVVNPYGGTYFEKNAEVKSIKAFALYSLKKGGPTGVDEVGRGGRGYVGRIAYIDHNGERHDYPSSALSMMPPSKDKNGNTLPATYLNLGGYDTRSAESSYSLKEITPGSYSEASNLLYKASRDGWSQDIFHQKCDNKGATYTRAIINDGRVLGAYTSLSWSTINSYQDDTTAFLYDGTTKFPSTYGVWGNGRYATYMGNGYFPTFGGGHDFYIYGGGKQMYNNAYTFTTSDGRAPFGRSRYSFQQYTLRDIEVYSVDAKTFPTTLNFERRLRVMPVGESITASFEKCRGMCDADENCGGFVYTKGSAGADGKCELKDRAKMYPVGLRVADPTKQLMLKVPTINRSSITDPSCNAIGGGGGGGGDVYKMIDSAQYSHYPDTGSMTSQSKCDIRHFIPNDGSRQVTDLKSLYGATDKEFDETERKTANYREQTAIKAPSASTTTEGMTIQEKNDNFYNDPNNNYGTAMKGVQDSLIKISNSKYQRERLIAITEETNKNLISESYKFILWSILAILVVLALLKLKEMFGQDDADDDGGANGGDAGGGLLATILGWFGVKSLSTNDIPDRTEDVKSALSSAGEQLKETGASIATGITEGADNLVNSANEMATGAIEGASEMVDKAKETASNAIDQAGSAASSMMSSSSSPTTGGAGRKSKKK